MNLKIMIAVIAATAALFLVVPSFQQAAQALTLNDIADIVESHDPQALTLDDIADRLESHDPEAADTLREAIGLLDFGS
jgi:hypothetical protein